MMQRRYPALSEAQLIRLGQALAPQLQPGDQVFLQGNLGAGKTTLARVMIQSLGYSGKVKSPSYTLVESYSLPQGFLVFHFDLYRLASEEELWEIGFEDYVGDNSVLLIEWPEKAPTVLGEPFFWCQLEPAGEGRCVTLLAHSSRGQQCLISLPEVL